MLLESFVSLLPSSPAAPSFSPSSLWKSSSTQTFFRVRDRSVSPEPREVRLRRVTRRDLRPLPDPPNLRMWTTPPRFCVRAPTLTPPAPTWPSASDLDVPEIDGTIRWVRTSRLPELGHRSSLKRLRERQQKFYRHTESIWKVSVCTGGCWTVSPTLRHRRVRLETSLVHLSSKVPSFWPPSCDRPLFPVTTTSPRPSRPLVTASKYSQSSNVILSSLQLTSPFTLCPFLDRSRDLKIGPLRVLPRWGTSSLTSLVFDESSLPVPKSDKDSKDTLSTSLY